MAVKQTQIRIRVPEDVKSWLEKQSIANLRSQNSEIILAIRDRMARTETE